MLKLKIPMGQEVSAYNDSAQEFSAQQASRRRRWSDVSSESSESTVRETVVVAKPIAASPMEQLLPATPSTSVEGSRAKPQTPSSTTNANSSCSALKVKAETTKHNGTDSGMASIDASGANLEADIHSRTKKLRDECISREPNAALLVEQPLRDEISGLKQRITELENGKSDKSEINSLKRKIADDDDEHTADLSSARPMIKMSKAFRIKSVEQLLTSTQGEIEKLKATVKKAMKDSDEALDTSKRIDVRESRTGPRLVALEFQQQQIRDKEDMMEKVSTGNAEKVAQLSTTLDHIQKEVSELSNGGRTDRRKVKKLGKEVKSMRAKIDALEKNNRKLQEKVEEIESDVEDERVDLEKLEEVVSRLEARPERKFLETQERVEAKFQERISELEAEKAKIEATLMNIGDILKHMMGEA